MRDQKEYLKNYYQKNKEKIKARSALRRKEKPEECKVPVEKWHKDPANQEYRKAYHRQYLIDNREDFNRRNRESYQRNKGKHLAQSRMYKIAKGKRIPAWLTDEDWKRMEILYREADRRAHKTGIKHHVDHIIPLRGKTVSGLHVPENLQVITANENQSKRNSFNVDVSH